MPADRIVSTADPRLLLPGSQPGRLSGTIELHVTRSWPDDASTELLYCLAYVGGRKARPAPSPAVRTEPPVAEKPAIVDPLAEPDSLPEEPAATATTAPATTDAVESMGYWPRYAIYLGNDALYFHSGDTIHRGNLTQAAITALAERRAIHFVFTFRESRIEVHANGLLCAQFKEPKGDPCEGLTSLPGLTTDQLVLGTLPEGRIDSCALVAETNGKLTLQSAAYDLGRWLRSFDGTLGGVRIWSRPFDEAYIMDPSGQTMLGSRGADDVARSISFPEKKGTTPPHYGDLVCFSAFHGPNPSLRAQYPVSGNWTNRLLTMRVAQSAPAGVVDTYGNVEERPLVTIMPTRSPSHWLVYQDAYLEGLLLMEPGATTGTLLHSVSEGVPVPVEFEEGVLRFRLPRPGKLFGGANREATLLVTLERPTLEFLGYPVDRQNPFFGSNREKYGLITFRAFDITKMDPLRAYEGYTGSAAWVFAEPERTEYRLNEYNVMVPFSHVYCPADAASGGGDVTLAHNERDYADAFAGHVGVWADTPNIAFSADLRARFKKATGNSKETSVGISKAIMKKYALVLSRTQARLHRNFESAVYRVARGMREGKSKQAAADFLVEFGTHFAMGTTFGAMMVQERTMDHTEIRTAVEKGIGLEAELKGGIRSGPGAQLVGTNEFGAKVGFDLDHSESSKEARRKDKFHFWLIPANGHIPSPEGPVSADIRDPAPLFFDLRPLCDLLTPANFDDPFIYHDVRDFLRAEIQAYAAAAGRKIEEGRGLNPWQVDAGEKRVEVRVNRIRVPRHFEGSLTLGNTATGARMAVQTIKAAQPKWLEEVWRPDAKSNFSYSDAKMERDQLVELAGPDRWFDLGFRKNADFEKEGMFVLRMLFEGKGYSDEEWYGLMDTGPDFYAAANQLKASSLGLGGYLYWNPSDPKLQQRMSKVPKTYDRGQKGVTSSQGGPGKRGGVQEVKREAPRLRFEVDLEVRRTEKKVTIDPPTFSKNRLNAYEKVVNERVTQRTNMADATTKLYQAETKEPPEQRAKVATATNAVVRRTKDNATLGVAPDGRSPAWIQSSTTTELLRADAEEFRGAMRLTLRALRLRTDELPAAAFFLRQQDRYLAFDVPRRPGRGDAERHRARWATSDDRRTMAPLPVQLVNGELVSAIAEFPVKLAEAEDGALYWVQTAGDSLDVLVDGVSMATKR